MTGQSITAWWRGILRGKPPIVSPISSGFTIIEVMIVLVVSSGLFIAAAVLISGRQNQTSFDQAVRQIQAEIQQTINDVAVGYFPDTNFRCSASPSGPALSGGASSGQGTNSGCIFLGKAMQFKLAGTTPEQFAVYSIAGLQQLAGNETTSLAEARPKVIAPGSAEVSTPGFPDLTVIGKLEGGLTTNTNTPVVRGMWFNNGGPKVPIGSVAFISSLASYDLSGGIKPGSQQVIVYPVGGSALDVTKTQGVDAINAVQFRNPAQSPPDPSDGVSICFASGGTDQSALIKIGGSKRSLSVTLKIMKGTVC